MNKDRTIERVRGSLRIIEDALRTAGVTNRCATVLIAAAHATSCGPPRPHPNRSLHGTEQVDDLGRGLISTQPNSDACEFDERQIVGCELVISGRDTPTLLDLVEEPFDQVARAIQIRAEADRVFAISFRRNVCPCSLLTGMLPDPVRIISAICE